MLSSAAALLQLPSIAQLAVKNFVSNIDLSN
jgi:hypothetical protein